MEASWLHSRNKSHFPFRAKVKNQMKAFKAVYISLCPYPDCIAYSSPTLLASAAMLTSCCSLTDSTLSGLRAFALTVPLLGFQGGTSGKKKPTCQCRRLKRHGFNPWVGKIPWRRAWQLTSVFLPGESPWTEEPGGLQSMGQQRVGYDRRDSTHGTHPFIGWQTVGLFPSLGCFE